MRNVLVSQIGFEHNKSFPIRRQVVYPSRHLFRTIIHFTRSLTLTYLLAYYLGAPIRELCAGVVDIANDGRPPIATLLAKTPVLDEYDLSSVNAISSGGATLAGAIEQMLYSRLPNLAVVGQGLGSKKYSHCVEIRAL